ncbi:MAG: TIGR00153 family protein [Legionellales bacterium]|nr:TIGR00153 family protein [Legionellales bacterium]|tara:strand:- start:4615 stop:5289 length:675 start_codon:yes stop_codon:yes gene_type:complete
MGNHIFKMFGRSPIRPIQKHMDKALSSARELQGFFAAVFDKDWQRAEEKQQAIAVLENEADTIKQDLRAHLPKGLFLPVSRGDLLGMLAMQDRIANKAKDIAGTVLGRRLHIPEALTPRFLDLLKRSVDTVEQTDKAINELDELLESGFRGNEVDLVENMINDISKIEHDADEIQVEVRHQLFGLEQDLPPVDVMFLYQVIDMVGELADYAEQVGDRLQLLLAR